MVWQLLSGVAVQPGEWRYSAPVPHTCKVLRLRSFTQPKSGRATFCLSVPDGQYGFKRFYPATEAVLIELPAPLVWSWRRVGLRGTQGLTGIWVVNIEIMGFR